MLFREYLKQQNKSRNRKQVKLARVVAKSWNYWKGWNLEYDFILSSYLDTSYWLKALFFNIRREAKVLEFGEVDIWATDLS